MQVRPDSPMDALPAGWKVHRPAPVTPGPAEAEPAPSRAFDSGLPPEWEAVESEAHGTYYHNTATGVTQ